MSEGFDRENRVYIAQGEQAVSDEDGRVITTILGSCVCACLHDPELGLGGMNHILVPDGGPSDIAARGAGAMAMETLINAMMKRGARRDRLTAKVFGGAAVVAGLSDIGEMNAKFVFRFLGDEGIPVLSQSVGGTKARQVRFWPASGRAQQRFVQAAPEAERITVAPPAPQNDVELF